MNYGSNKTSRAAYTLFELVLVITVVGMIGTMSVRLFHSLFRQQSATSAQLAANMSNARLRNQITKDANNAIDDDITNSRVLLTLPDDVVVRWERESNYLVRTVEDASGIRNDHFDIPPAMTFDFQATTIQNGVSLLQLNLRTNLDESTDRRFITTSRDTTISAELSRDHRWTNLKIAEDEE